MNKIYACCSPLRLVKMSFGYVYEVTAFFIYNRKPKNMDIYERENTANCIDYGSLQGIGKTAKEAKLNFWKQWNTEHKGIYLDTGLYEPQYNNETL